MIPNYVVTMLILPVFLVLKSILTLCQSKGKCIVFHGYQRVPEKYSGDPRDQPLKMEGIIEWQCPKCKHSYNEKWSAF